NFADDSIYVEHLRTLPIDSVKEFLEELNKCFRNRKVASHLLNAESSRSHMLAMLKIEQKFRDGIVKTSNLNFGDLGVCVCLYLHLSKQFVVVLITAGSEDIRKALGDSPDPERLKEAIAINSSLTALTTCINDIVHKKKPTHRVHPLTHILKDSLGGNSKATVVVCCSSHMMNRNETIRTLRFAEAAKQVKNKAKINTELGKTAMQNRLKELERENKELNSKVVELQALLDVVRSQKRQTATENKLVGLKEMRQSATTSF
ncbi:kinesin-like protein FLA10, partial [Reticulomyxa filosa]